MEGDSRQSRQAAVFACLEQIAVGDSAETGTSSLFELVREMGASAYFDALHDVMESSSCETQVVACANMITSNPGTALARRAVQLLQMAIQQGPPDLQRYAAYHLFFTGTATSEMVPVLDELFDRQEANDNRRLWVAGALLHAAEPSEEQGHALNKARRALFEALRSNDPYSVIMAGMAFGRKQLHQDEIVAAFLRIYRKSDDTFRQAILGQFAKLGVPTPEVVDLLTNVAKSIQESAGMRLAAMNAMAHMPRETNGIDDVMLGLLHDHDWQIVLLAFGSLRVRHTELPKRELNRLKKLLSSPDQNLRGVAAQCATDLGIQIESLLPRLIERLEQEEISSILEAIIAAISSSGALALPLLAKALPTAHLRAVQLFQYAFLAIGRNAPRELAGLLSSPEQRTRQAVAWAIQSLGPIAEPAVEVMVSFLRNSDRQVVHDTLIAFGQIGGAGRAASRTLAELLLDSDATIREWAEQALVSIGYEAIAAIEELRFELEHESHPILDRLLQRLSHAVPVTSSQPATGVEGITDENDLQRFALIGNLTSENGPMSFQNLAIAIEQLKETDETLADLPSSAATLRLTLDRLEEALTVRDKSQVRLLDRGKNRKGGLTERGKSFLRKVVQYLERNSRG